MDGPVTKLYRARLAEAHLKPDPGQEAVLPEFERMAAGLAAAGRPNGLKRLFRKAGEAQKGLYLWGGVGRGKSMLMDLFVEALGPVPKRRVHFHAFMQEMHAALHLARKTGVKDAVAPVAAAVAETARVLAFDEMQITDITDAMLVGRLFEKLFDAGVVVVTTSNRPPEALYKDGLNRQLFLPFIALLKARMEVREIGGETDHRRQILGREQCYFQPADAVARGKVEALWRDLGGDRAEPLTLSVKGREVTLPAYQAGAGRASFWELCGRPLGPADYLALAAELKVLVLDEVPMLSSENYNMARRFVTLVDALYEAKTRLVVSAADLPERLYIEGEGSFEFARTASRLREMTGLGGGE